MTGGTQTDLYFVFAAGFQAEGFIERGYGPGLGNGHPHVIANQGEVLRRNVTVLRLDILEEIDQMLRVTGISFQNSVNVLSSSLHPWPPIFFSKSMVFELKGNICAR
jgi:hypothetical protein